MSKRMQHCYNCGAELGVYYQYPGDHDTCGDPECDKALRDDERAARSERQYEAEQDDYSLYG